MSKWIVGLGAVWIMGLAALLAYQLNRSFEASNASNITAAAASPEVFGSQFFQEPTVDAVEPAVLEMPMVTIVVRRGSAEMQPADDVGSIPPEQGPRTKPASADG